MRVGWSLKEASAVLGIHERRVTQALDPALDKIGRLWNVDPTRTLRAILDRASELQADAVNERTRPQARGVFHVRHDLDPTSANA